jgi:hypothetical protein
MEKQILREMQELKIIMAKLIGTSGQTVENHFSEEALNRAQKDFLKMSTERGEWVGDDDIGKYINPAPWNAGVIIRKEFEFTNWFKRGHHYLYSKKDLIALGKELSDRNIDLKRYKELLEDKAAFDKKVAGANSKSKPFKIPSHLKDISTSEIPKPSPDLPRQDLERLKQEFKIGKLSAYIDIYMGTHAMLKQIYHYEKYMEPGLKRRCGRWCEDFNYANRALELITGKGDKFMVSDPDH